MKLKVFLFLVLMNSLLAIAQNYGQMTDARDGKIYKTVRIGTQTWMAQNLNFESKNSWVYKNLTQNGENMGRLYTWEAANIACPAGWHLPDDEEWKKLEISLGMSAAEADRDGDWRGTNQATLLISDSTIGFMALMAGYRNMPSNYNLLGQQTFFWTSTSIGNIAWMRQIYIGSPKIFRRTRPYSWGFSVRCVMNN